MSRIEAAGFVRAGRRVALVLRDLLPLAGSERVNVVLAAEFTRQGVDVDIVLACEPGDVRAVLPSGARIFEFGAERLRNFVRPFRRYLIEQKPDVVIVSMWPLTFMCVLAKTLARSSTRMLVVEHNTLSAQYARWGCLHAAALRASLRLAYPRADARIGVSKGVVDDLANLTGLPRQAFDVVHNPVPLGRPSSQTNAVVEAAWQGWRGFRILNVGKFKTQKSHVMLVRAFGRLLKTTDARLMILGEGELRDAIWATVCAEGLADKVYLPGYFSEPMPFYQSADLFALSSDYEGFGNVIVEALSCGVPVVSTNCRSGPAEILENGRFGALVPVGDEAALAAAMDAALHARHDRAALLRRAADFAPGLAAEKYLRLAFPEAAAKDHVSGESGVRGESSPPGQDLPS
jgi:glycosyltransferase involved in cell wall biosynthesis